MFAISHIFLFAAGDPKDVPPYQGGQYPTVPPPAMPQPGNILFKRN